MRNALGAPQTVLVLGGTSDIGLAIAAQLRDRGARRIVLAGRDPAALERAADGLRRPGTEVTTGQFDADDVEGHPEALAKLSAAGDVDVVVAAWGVLGDQAAAEADPAAAVAVARTNYLGAVSALTVTANLLRSQGHGAIVVLSSVAGERVRRANYVYGSTKAGLDGFCQGLAAALVGSGVHLLVVRPGFVTTKMTAGMKEVPFSTTPEAVAEATAAALAAGRSVVWVPSPLRFVMSALRHVPTPVFRRLPL